MNRTCILILGMHRSGTSTVAGILANGGLYFGEDFIDILPENPKGFYEHREFNSLHYNILKSTHYRWYSFITDNFKFSRDHYNKEFKYFIINNFKGRKAFGLKEPRSIHFLNEIEDNLKNLHVDTSYIYVKRNSGSVAYSIKKRDRLPIWYSLCLSKLYENKIEKFLKNKEYFQIDYEQIISDSQISIKALNEFTNATCNVKLDELSGSNFIDTNLNRSVFTPSKIYYYLSFILYHVFTLLEAIGIKTHLIVERFYNVRKRP